VPLLVLASVEISNASVSPRPQTERLGLDLGLDTVTKPLARLLEPLRIATILNIYLSNGM